MAKGQDQFEDHYERRREQEDRHQRSLPGENDLPLPPPPEAIKNQEAPPGRNDPCPCGSGKKYKQCCLKKEQ